MMDLTRDCPNKHTTPISLKDFYYKKKNPIYTSVNVWIHMVNLLAKLKEKNRITIEISSITCC